MLKNAIAPRPHLKSFKGMDEQLKTHSGHTFSYEYYQKLLKSAAQNHDKSNRVDPPLAALKVYEHNINLISDLTKTHNSSEETCDIDSPTPVLMANMMCRRGNNNKFNGNGNKHALF